MRASSRNPDYPSYGYSPDLNVCRVLARSTFLRMPIARQSIHRRRMPQCTYPQTQGVRYQEAASYACIYGVKVCASYQRDWGRHAEALSGIEHVSL